MPPLVTSNVTGPEETLILLGVQPASTSVTPTLLAPFGPEALDPQPARSTAAIGKAPSGAPVDNFIFNRPPLRELSLTLDDARGGAVATGRRAASGSRRSARRRPRAYVGSGCSPSIPVSNEDVTVPGTTSQLRSSACPWKLLSHAASCAVWAALASSPPATSTSTTDVTLKNRARLIRIPPRYKPRPITTAMRMPSSAPSPAAARCRLPETRRAGTPPSRDPRAAPRRTPSPTSAHAEPLASASAAMPSSSAFMPAGVPAHPDDHERHDADRADADDRLEHLLLALRKILVEDLEGDADAGADHDREQRRRAHTYRSARRSPCWRRNAAMMPTISAASSPSRSPIT